MKPQNSQEIKIKELPTIELLYICDDEFKQGIKGIRDEFGIKIGGDGLVPVEKVLAFDIKLFSDEALQKRYSKEINRICKKYDLLNHEMDVQIFIESGITPHPIIKGRAYTTTKITKPEIKPRERAKGKVAPIAGLNVRFKIRKHIVSKDLKTWLEQHKGKILIAVNEYFSEVKAAPTRPALTRLDRLDRAIKIIQMRDSEGKKFREITNAICEENSNDPEVIDGKVNEQSIKMLYYRYKKRFKKLHNKK